MLRRHLDQSINRVMRKLFLSISALVISFLMSCVSKNDHSDTIIKETEEDSLILTKPITGPGILNPQNPNHGSHTSHCSHRSHVSHFSRLD